MIEEWTLEFSLDAALGKVFRVDTTSVWAEAIDHDRIAHTAVGSLVAVQGLSPSEYLIGILDRVTRDMQEEELPDQADPDGFVPIEARPRDLFRLTLIGTYRRIDGTKTNTFKRGADSFPLIEASCWAVEGQNLQRLMGLLSKQLEPEKQLRLGVFMADPTAIAIADGDRLFQRHAALLGSTGSGKSWAVALILERAKVLLHSNIIVFDLHGEYTPLTVGESPIAQGFRIAGPGDIGSNEHNGSLYLPWWLLNQEEMQALLLDRAESNAPNQAARLTHHVRNLKHELLVAQSLEDVASSFTVDSPVPFDLDQLISRLEADDTEMVAGARAGSEKAGPFNGKLTRFIHRVRSRIEDRRYGFMFSPPEEAINYEWLHGMARQLLGTDVGIKIIDFSEVPSDVLPIVVGLLARILYEIRFWTTEEKRTPVALVCDEAHLYIPSVVSNSAEQRALDAFERIAKEGRKYGVSVLVVSQRPSDVSRTVLSQCNNYIVLRLTNDQDQAVIRRLMPDSLEGLTSALPLLDIGEALVLGDAIILPTRIKLDKPRIKPVSATKDFWTEWGANAVIDEDIVAAVEAMRKQSRA